MERDLADLLESRKYQKKYIQSILDELKVMKHPLNLVPQESQQQQSSSIKIAAESIQNYGKITQNNHLILTVNKKNKGKHQKDSKKRKHIESEEEVEDENVTETEEEQVQNNKGLDYLKGGEPPICINDLTDNVMIKIQ
ncbi:hypothetical protein G6F69_007061 [Rhizopus microsporus]|nr:hypothetical protein G6F69_007061 [Rhizopus microsporus]